MLVVSTLAEKNIRPYIEEIKDYLSRTLGHPFLKNNAINSLKRARI